MNITFTGRHVEVTEALRSYAMEKLSALTRHYDKITQIQMIFAIEKVSQIAEATLHVPHGDAIHAEAKSDDMYSSIDLLTEKLKRQLIKHKEKETDRR